MKVSACTYIQDVWALKNEKRGNTLVVFSRFCEDMAKEIKLATTVAQQLCRLKERGMKIEDESFAEEILLDVGYYRLGFYWFPMEKKYPHRDERDHLFKDNASFSTSVHLYEFDKAFRNLLSSYLLDIEVNVRTKVIYLISNLHKENPTWFADNKIVMAPYISQLEIKYNREVANNDVIKRHAAKHINDKYAPAWKTLEYLSFGDLIRLIENLKSSDTKLMIYGCYGFNEGKTFPNYIEIVRSLRNTCAHGHPVFDVVFPKSLRAGKLKNVLKGKNLHENFYSNMQGALLAIQYLLYYLPCNKGDEFREKMKLFFETQITEDIRPMVGYLQNVPWLTEKI